MPASRRGWRGLGCAALLAGRDQAGEQRGDGFERAQVFQVERVEVDADPKTLFEPGDQSDECQGIDDTGLEKIEFSVGDLQIQVFQEDPSHCFLQRSRPVVAHARPSSGRRS